MNFGIPGVIVYFSVVALLLVKLERVSWSNPYALAAWALILGPLLWTARNDFSNFFRPVCWGLSYLGTVRVLMGKRQWFRSAATGSLGLRAKVQE